MLPSEVGGLVLRDRVKSDTYFLSTLQRADGRQASKPHPGEVKVDLQLFYKQEGRLHCNFTLK